MIFTILKVDRHHTPCSACSYTYSMLCVLFVPVKYRAVGSFDNTDIRAKAHV